LKDVNWGKIGQVDIFCSQKLTIESNCILVIAMALFGRVLTGGIDAK
jgi:hypothetical protein